jgi:TIR domain
MAQFEGGKKVFIVYASNEEPLASSLKSLFEHWGLEAFYCRQKEREASPGEGYRRLLRTKLKNADLAVLLLSREFQWSRYCQSEAGAAATLEIDSIGIVIPPAEVNDVAKIAPVLDGYDVIIASSPSTAKTPHQFASELRTMINCRLRPTAGALIGNAEQTRIIRQLEEQLKTIVEGYEIRPKERELFDVWPSITDNDPPARRSIVENIKRSLRDSRPKSSLAIVGVSLKFSLALITQALEELATECERTRTGRVSRRHASKTLEIQLVHMDDHAHILHALNDSIDIETIREKLNREGPEIFEKWHLACERASIHLAPLQRKRIDYIPPRVGILIDEEFLYEGHCAFHRKGAVFHLLVGERNYFFYSAKGGRYQSSTSQKAIQEFKTFLQVFGENRFNGVELKSDWKEWLSRLEDSIDSYPDVREVVLISQSATKFQSLIGYALRKGWHVKIYVQRPDKASGGTKVMISSLRERIEREISQSSSGVAEIYYYDHVPTFRAALIGDELLGVQLYVHSRDESRAVEPGALRLIATKHSSEFVALRDGLVGDFLQSELVSQRPDEIIHCMPRKTSSRALGA